MDKFNDIWKNRFNEGDMPVGDWNTPDAQVWENVLPHVAPKNDRKKWVFILLGILLLIILLLSYFTFNNTNNKLSEVNTSVETIIQSEASPVLAYLDTPQQSNIIVSSSDQTVLPKESAIKEAPGNKISANNHKQSSPQKAKKLSTIKKVEPTKVLSSKTIFGEEGVHPKSTFSESGAIKSNEESEVGLAEEILMKEDYSALQKPLELERDWSGNLPLLSSKTFFVDFDAKDNQLPASAQIDIPEIVTTPSAKLKLALQSGAVLWQHNISEAYTNDLAPFDFNYSDDIGWFTGVNVQIPINNYLDIFGAAQYEQIQTTSGHNSMLEYNLATELGSNSNAYELNLATPYGASGASFKFDRTQDINDTSVDLAVDFKSTHTIRNLSLPIGIKAFPMGQRQRLVPSVTIGFGTNYLIGISNDIQSIDTHHDAIGYAKDENTKYQNPNLTQWHFDARLGLGLGYNITNSIQMDLNFDWSRGLNPVFEQESYKTRINRYHLSLGLIKTF